MIPKRGKPLRNRSRRSLRQWIGQIIDGPHSIFMGVQELLMVIMSGLILGFPRSKTVSLLCSSVEKIDPAPVVLWICLVSRDCTSSLGL